MCYSCLRLYLQNRSTTSLDIDILESIVAQHFGLDDYRALRGSSQIPHQTDPNFETVIAPIKTQLLSFGYEFIEGDIVPQAQDINNQFIQIFSTLMGTDLVSSGTSTRGRVIMRFGEESESDDSDEEESSEENDEELLTLSSNSQKWVDKLLELKNEEDVTELVKKLTSLVLPPLSSSQSKWFEEFFQKIPFEYTYRYLAIQTGLKMLNLSPGDFSRTKEQTAEIINKSFVLIENIRDSSGSNSSSSDSDICCGICHNDLTECSTKLNEQYSLVCQFKKCKHLFCYTCFHYLQTSLAGENCPICRE